MIQMEERHKKILLDILKKYPYTFYAFGSRTKEKARRLSDLDIYFFEDIPPAVRGQLEEDLDNSDLPYTVDLVDGKACSDEFKAAIENDLVCLQKKP
jgi:predicted nucleotidyltransferase